jgi:hypothetical protein
MNGPLEKGNRLERAVRAIEETILAESPAFRQDAFTIESKKLIVSRGVKHEIDLWARVDLGRGYEALFVFECKNWEEKVGKNEISVFSEKIRATNAQKGFFVAKSFTKYAVAQAATDQRMQLLTVADLPTENVPVPFDFHFIIFETANVDLAFKVRARTRCERPMKRSKVKDVVLNGERIDIDHLTRKWIGQVWNERSGTFPSGTLPEGTYPVTAEGEKHFEPNELAAEGQDVDRVLYKVEFKVRVVRPAIVSYFDLESRGRAMQLAPVQFGDNGLIRVTLVGIEPSVC